MQPEVTAPQDAYERARLENLHPAGWRNPQPAERYTLVVVGAGTAGLVAAHAAAALGAKVALIERALLGGDCLNVGCVPSKVLLRTARLYAEMRHAEHYGGRSSADVRVDFPAVMQRMRRVRARISRADSIRRLDAAGVDVFFGTARFTGSDTLTVDGTKLRFKKALVATGARPDTPAIPGLSEAGYLTNENVFDLIELPPRLLVIGGGPLGCELAQAFSRFGSQTIIAHEVPLFLPREERDAAQILSDAFARDGIEVRLNTCAVNVRVENGQKLVDLISDDYKSTVAVDAILTGTGRVPNVEGLDLEAAGVDYDNTLGIRVDDFLQTSNRRIYAAGDACLEHKFTHTADASARVAVQNALFFGRQRLSALTIPWCTYTDPEIAHVGLYVRQARGHDIAVKTFTVPMHDVDRAITDAEETGFVKLHVKEGTDRILGATIVARHAGEMINEITLAMVAGIGLRTLARVIHAYPTQADAIKKAADAYNRTRLTPVIRSLLRHMMRLTSAFVVPLVIAASGSALAASPDNPQAPAGAALYGLYCKPCHGADLTGYAADNAPSLVSPTFRATADDAFLRSAIERGRAGTAMGGYGKRFGGPLADSEVAAIIRYLRGDTKASPLPAQPSTGSAAQGERVYRMHCESCHGTTDQRGSAVHLANSMFLDSASDAYLRLAIVQGRPGTPMEAWHGKLSPQEIEDVVAYLRSLARAVPPPPASAGAGGPASNANVPIVINPRGKRATFKLRDDRYVSIADVGTAYEKKRRLVIVDARTPADYQRLHIAGAISIPHFDMRDIDKVPKDGTWVVVYCACPHHLSDIVMEEFRKRGYANSAVLDEGIFAWQRKGYPTFAAPGQLPIPAPPANSAAKPQ